LTGAEVIGTFRLCNCPSCLQINAEGVVWAATAYGESDERVARGDKPARERTLLTVWAEQAGNPSAIRRGFSAAFWESLPNAR
jgi:hypothetical protein